MQITQWEYRSVAVTRQIKQGFGWSLSEWLPKVDYNAMGQEGWELVSVTPIQSHVGAVSMPVTTEIVHFFKRPCG
jgi:hypothetical protein